MTDTRAAQRTRLAIAMAIAATACLAATLVFIGLAGERVAGAASIRLGEARSQAAMDRRFDRERYEATQIIDSFAGHVRAEVELDAILDDLRVAASRTVRPSATACWIRDPAPR